MLSTDKLRDKEVPNICDGRSIGFVSDIEVDLESGTAKVSGASLEDAALIKAVTDAGYKVTGIEG